MRVFDGAAELEAAVGAHLGQSEWHVVDQAQIDAFADATGDDQWIHVDPVKAADGPFGSTVAHGFLTLSMVSILASQVYRVEGVTMVVNYGANKVRFPSPVPVGSRIRAAVELSSVTRITAGHQVGLRVTIQRDGGDKPACVADMLAVVVP